LSQENSKLQKTVTKTAYEPLKEPHAPKNTLKTPIATWMGHGQIICHTRAAASSKELEWDSSELTEKKSRGVTS